MRTLHRVHSPLDGIQLILGWELKDFNDEIALVEPLINVAANILLFDAAQQQERSTRYVLCGKE